MAQFFHNLSERQRQVAELFMDGKRASEIARELHLSPSRIGNIRQLLCRRYQIAGHRIKAFRDAEIL